MSLGPQCWGCRWRRVKCDSQQPSCTKCTQKELPCPGYATTKPLRWRHRITKQGMIDETLPKLGFHAPVQDDVAPAHVILDALNYYNSVVTPDLAADGSSSSYIIDISKWASFNKSKRHLTLCLVTLHRAVRKYGDVNQNQALFHYHQACAAEILNGKIKTSGQVGPDPELFEDVSLFFFSQIQASAYGAWRAHLNAAKTLLNLWGTGELMGKPEYEFHFCQLVIADVFGTTMAPAPHISNEDISQHEVYLDLLERFNVDFCGTMVPIPKVIVRATALINIARARKEIGQNAHIREKAFDPKSSATAIFESLREFDPTDWSLHLPRRTSNHATSWALLATCFKMATILYLAHTCASNLPANMEEPVGDENLSTYRRLSQSIQELYNLRRCGGVLYKYILWPMAICGVEAVVQKDKQQIRFLCESLEWTTVNLGTLSMREAAAFLEELWKGHIEMTDDGLIEAVVDWDTIFNSAPLFLM